MKAANPVSTAAASGGVAGAAVVIIAWALSLAHIDMPAEVAAALMVLIAPLLHLIVVRFGGQSSVVGGQEKAGSGSAPLTTDH